MKYSIYAKELQNKNILNQIDEIIIPYEEEDTSFLDFCLQHIKQRIIIDISDFYVFQNSNGIKKIQGIKNALPQLDITLRIPYDKENCYLLKKYNLPFFCNKFANT